MARHWWPYITRWLRPSRWCKTWPSTAFPSDIRSDDPDGAGHPSTATHAEHVAAGN